MFHYCFTQTKREIINLVIHSLIERTDLEPHNLEVPGSSPGWSTQLVSRLSFGKRLIFFFSSWQMGLLVIGGTVCSTLAAYLMGYSRADIRDGLYGFNGALAAVPLSVAGHWLGMAWGITTLTAAFVVSVWFVWIVRKIGSKRGASFLQ